jgi:transcriptional regulator of heat shock response
MSLTERRQKILNSLIEDYINTARPVSSSYLAKKHRLGVSPATIRWELLELTDEGFLEQPHTSAGRIPTNNGYRFFVDYIEQFLNEKTALTAQEKQTINNLVNSNSNIFKEMVKELAQLTNLAVFGASREGRDVYGAGWEGFFSQPEVKQESHLAEEAGAIIDKIFEDFENFWQISDDETFIGNEHPMLSENFSVVLGKTKNKQDEIKLVILGPNRLNYRRCLNLISFLEEF